MLLSGPIGSTTKEIDMTKKKVEEQKKQIEVNIDFDASRLYGKIDGVIAYLQELRQQHSGVDLLIDFGTSGYDSVEEEISYYREETDEEFARRLAELDRQRKAREEEARREEQRKKDLREYERLKSKLGIWR